MRIKKVTQTTPTPAQIINSYSESTTDGYSANYINNVGIVESGSNANGHYIKFGDGTMICSQQFSLTTTITNSWGNLYSCSAQTPPNYPVTFTEVYSKNICVSEGKSALVISWQGGTLSNFGQFVLLRSASSSNNDTYIVNITTIGKWK